MNTSSLADIVVHIARQRSGSLTRDSNWWGAFRQEIGKIAQMLVPLLRKQPVPILNTDTAGSQ
jgi:hypothetical protein